jgi:hypothetical protein
MNSKLQTFDSVISSAVRLERKSREINLFGNKRIVEGFIAFLTPFKVATNEMRAVNVPTPLFNDIMEN